MQLSPETWANVVFPSTVIGLVLLVFVFWKWVIKLNWRMAVSFTGLMVIEFFFIVYTGTLYSWTSSEPSLTLNLLFSLIPTSITFLFLWIQIFIALERFNLRRFSFTKFKKITTNVFFSISVILISGFALFSFISMYQKVIYDATLWRLLKPTIKGPSKQVIETYRKPNMVQEKIYYLKNEDKNADIYLYCADISKADCPYGFKVVVWNGSVRKLEGMTYGGRKGYLYLSYFRWFESYLLFGKYQWDTPRGY